MGLSQEEFDKLREERRKVRGEDDAAREAQMGIDRESILALEEQIGEELDTSLTVKKFVSGLPAMIGVRCPKPVEYKRFAQKINASKATPDTKRTELESLGKLCLVYPAEAEMRDRLLEEFPALLLQVGTTANRLAELAKEDEGKD